MSVRTRFAPSPTGYLHIGGARTALFCWLFARQQGGQFVLRIEDTDLARSTEASVQAIFDGMRWLGLDHDEGPFFQTRRFDRYREVVQQLLDDGHAYHCYCTPEEIETMREAARARGDKPRYNGYWRDRQDSPPEGVSPVVRFRNPLAGEVVIDDAVKGQIVVDNAELDDLVIMRSDGTPTYNLTVVVDDMDMQISHVIRGDDHVNNTPRQINILRALGAPLPIYAHLPMILGEDGKRLSKRHGAVSVMQYEAEGYLPEALLNYLVRLGWSHGDEELFSLAQMTELFSLEAVNRAGGVFDTKKLDWVNQHHMQTAPAGRLAEALLPYVRRADISVAAEPSLAAVADALRDRANNLVDMAEAVRYFYEAPVGYDPKAAKKQLNAASIPRLQAVADALAVLNDWQAATIQQTLESVVQAQEVGFGKIGQPLRVAVTGGGASPGMDITLFLVGRDAVLQRIASAINHIQNNADKP